MSDKADQDREAQVRKADSADKAKRPIGRPRGRREPWVELGLSKATYYRRNKRDQKP
jgi:hypothetical protein